MATDEDWRPLAEGSRTALALLGYEVAPQCLPGEPEPCGGDYRQHVIAHLSALKAVIDHHLTHFSPATVAPIFSVTYAAVMLDVEGDCHVSPLSGS